MGVMPQVKPNGRATTAFFGGLMTTQKFYLYLKIVATAALLIQGSYYSITQPGVMDAFNAIMAGLAVLAIWRPK